MPKANTATKTKTTSSTAALSAVPDPDPDPGPIATPEQELPVSRQPQPSADADWFGDLKAEDDKLKCLWYGVEGTGKSLLPSTLVMTPSGPLHLGKIEVGDEVIGRNGRATTVTGVFPQRRLETYRIEFSDNTYAVCCEDHLWTVQSPKNVTAGKYQTLSVKQLLGRVLTKADKRSANPESALLYRVPLVDPIQYESRELPVDPYLLGVLLGDGSMVDATIITRDEATIERIKNRCPDLGEPWRNETATSVRWRFGSVRAELEKLGVLYCKAAAKFVPLEYLLGSVQQRLDLLRGLMDTDGSVVRRQSNAGGMTRFHTRSPQLADAVANLVQSLGGIAVSDGGKPSRANSFKHSGVVYEYEAGRATDYTVRVTMPLETNPFYLERKTQAWDALSKRPPQRRIRSIMPEGMAETVCIKVDAADSLYVIENHIVTHNTTAAAMAANQGRVLIINAESGVKFHALQARGINVKNIRVWPNPDNPQPITSATLDALHIRLLSDLRNDPDSWYAVIFDSLTEIHHALREQATERRVNKVQGTDPDWVDRDDYGIMTTQMRKTLRRFRDLPCHVLFTALETVDEKKDEIRPAITPALCNDVMGYVDIAMRMGSPTDDFRARCTKSGRIRAKDRFSLLPPRLMEPNFVRVKDYVLNGITEDQDDIQFPLREEERIEEEKRAADEAVKDLDKPAAGKKPARRRASTRATESADAEPKEENNNAETE